MLESVEVTLKNKTQTSVSITLIGHKLEMIFEKERRFP